VNRNRRRNMKYELTEETFYVRGLRLYRVRYLESGELGGWIESEKNLAQKGTAKVCESAWVYGNAKVYEDAQVCGVAVVCGNALVSGNAQVYGSAWMCGNAKVYEGAKVCGDAVVCGSTRVCGDAQVYGYAGVHEDAQVYDNAQVYGDAVVRGCAQVYGDAQVCGRAQVYGDARICGDTWDVAPLQIQGTRFPFCVSSQASLSIGCMTVPLDAWPAACEQYFDTHRFTEDERIEYKLYFNLAANLYGWDVPLFPVGRIEEKKAV
jgi:carbonic anhydrase/acetyltransferase-like protein (isoleucine patch superfamily)